MVLSAELVRQFGHRDSSTEYFSSECVVYIVSSGATLLIETLKAEEKKQE